MNGLVESSITDDLLFGSSDVMQQLRQQLNSIADCCLPVLIEGESGTGKDVLARAIHARSARRSRALLNIRCSVAAPLTVFEKIVNGQEPDNSGSDAASRPRNGDCPSIGTVVFDNIGELELSSQSQVVALLQEARFAGIGNDGVQVVCTTRVPLKPKLESGSFREDLYYRINVVNLVLPPLRERRCDIPCLVSHFLTLYGEIYQRESRPFSQSLMGVFVEADWPGNIRELENAVKRYIILGSAEPIIAELRDGASAAGAATERSLKALKRHAVRDCEYKVILSSLNRNNWNRRQAARELDISYRSLLYAMDQLGLKRKRNALHSATAPVASLVSAPVAGND